ncbi:MAG: RluA family pseudouridine synthase [Actinomycetota bacterium]|nr:RluA family pseudouridine synthase [Actinomycetota bacterium]
MAAGQEERPAQRVEIPGALAGERLDRAVSVLWDLARREAAALVEAGSVRMGGRVVTSRSHRLAEGDVLEVALPPAVEPEGLEPDPSVPVRVVHADEQVIVVDKPAGLVVHPGAGHSRGTLVQGLLAAFPEVAGVGDPERPGIVHRLDVGTSGLLVVARTPAAYASLVDQLSARSVQRNYLALVLGRMEAGAGLIDAPVGRGERDRTQMAVAAGGRQARTRYEVLERFTHPAVTTLLECSLETGRTHQIRVHLAAIRHPVVGDLRYGGRCPPLPVDRPFLHAHRLSFDHPATGERRVFGAPLPEELKQIREQLA